MSTPDWTQYPQRLLDAMGVGAPPVLGSASEFHVQALFQPSFHADVCLRIFGARGGGALVALDRLVSGRATTLTALGVRGMGTDAIRVERAESWLDADRAEAVVSTLYGIETPRPPGLGLDGCPITVWESVDGRSRQFKTWSPRPGAPEHHYVAALFEACFMALPAAPPVHRSREQLHGYLELGPPFTATEGRLRCFGILTSSDESDLRRALNALPDGGTIELDGVDMIAGALAGMFREYARRAPVRWVLREEQRDWIARYGLPEGRTTFRL